MLAINGSAVVPPASCDTVEPPIAPSTPGAGSLVGYARVSTVDQNPELQSSGH